MRLGETQDFASPEEAIKALDETVLEHYGVKGMRWGVRKKEETSERVFPGERTSTGKVKPLDVPKSAPKPASPSVLSEKQQQRVDKFLEKSDVMGTKISELKLANEALQDTRNPSKVYARRLNEQGIRDLEAKQKRALRDVEAVQKGKLTSTQKKLIVGAVAATAIVGAVAISRGQQSGALNSYLLRSSALLRGQKVPFNVDKSLSGHMSAGDLLNKVAKPVNPGYSTMGGKMNCRRSTYAYELRRRGFDVHATTSAVGWGQSESGVINAVTTEGKDFFKRMSMSEAVTKTGASTVARGDTRINPIPKILLGKLNTGGPDGMTPGFGSKKVFETLSKQPNGARGEVLFKFPNFGHSMAYEIVNGKPHIFDSQKGTYHDLTKLVEDKWGSFNGAEITRLDNVDLDLNFLTRWATNN